MIVIVKELGKASKSVELETGTTIAQLLSKMALDPTGKSFTVTGANGSSAQTAAYVLQDADVLHITANNAAA